ncbi:transketolase [Undibacterium sp. RuRC25W]|uniref:transketolase n=1 Tax=Undibacterium sp. RuRC25W TaxID=3413047 RepID=UPI003BF3AB67
MSFKQLCQEARLRLLRMHYDSKVGHLGGNLSCLDALLYLHHHVLQKEDTFVLAKGHAAGALYIALWSIGRLTDGDLAQFHRDATLLAGHPVAGWLPEIAVATGSLGHGFPVSTGMALAKRLQCNTGRVFCLMSDGEWQEGSNWEALIFSRHQQLNNLTILIDVNGLQGFGTTTEVASMGDLHKRLSAFDVKISVIDGHDPEQLAVMHEPAEQGPHVVFMNTIKGKGVSFMENRLEWHYLPLNSAQYEQARQEVEAP